MKLVIFNEQESRQYYGEIESYISDMTNQLIIRQLSNLSKPYFYYPGRVESSVIRNFVRTFPECSNSRYIRKIKDENETYT